MKSVSVVSNARLQSSRVPQKLVRPFAGRSLLDIALEKLDQMDFFEHRYLAVAEDELAEMAKPYRNVEVLRRQPDAVRKGVNPQRVTFAHYLQVPSDYIFVFNPCLPLITIDTIRRAFDYFQRTDHPSYTAVFRTGDWIFDGEGNPLTNTDPQNVTTNKNTTFFKGAHAFHIVSKQRFANEGIHWAFVRNDPHLIEIPDAETADVDTEMEFMLAEMLYCRQARKP